MTLGRRNLIIEPLCLFRVECQRELRGPVQLMTRVRHCVIAVTRTGQTECDIGGVGRDLAGDDALADVIFIRQTQVLRRCNVAQEVRARLCGNSAADGRGKYGRNPVQYR